MLKAIVLILSLYLLILLFSCAKMEYPGGGPEDKKAPKITETVPEHKTTRFKGKEVLITFSEDMSERTVKEALSFIPPNFFKVKGWKGTTLILEPTKPYSENQTYIINMNTNARDLQGNPLTSQFILVFSTGKSLADGIISGTLIWKLAEANQLKLGRVNLTSMQDSTIIYTTTTDSTGTFFFKYLAKDRYKIEAFLDIDNNQKYSDTREPGISQVLDITTGNREALDLELTVFDTIPPKIGTVISSDRENLIVKFDEEIKLDSLKNEANWRISPSEDSTKTAKIYTFFNAEAKTREWYFRTETLDAKKKYKIYCKYAEDISKNIGKNLVAEFESNESIDSTFLKVSKIEPSAGKAAVSIRDSITIYLNREFDRESLQKAFTLKAQAGTETVFGKWSFPHPLRAIFTPNYPLSSKIQYVINIDTSLVDYRGWKMDKPFQSTFTTEVSEEPGSFSGSIIYRAINAPIVISLSKGSGWTMTTTISKPGPYEIKKVPAGIYTVNAFIDNNKNGKLDVGESFGSYRGVVVVKSGIATTNIDVTLFP
ncbi:MAG: Ig-like domain-containing protein [Candidatus Coatesbacteria bacterium]|nr:Ig-like domain-containing protein [Candidatus Coatesbacteria bacterium]